MKEFTIFDAAIEFIRLSVKDTEWSNKVYLVGGCVRDKIMGLPIKDIDLMIDCMDGGIKFANWMVEHYPNVCKNLVLYPRFGTSKFTININGDKDVDIECVMPRAEKYEEYSRKPIDVKYCTLVEDAMRRDFTVNALYMNITNNEIIDPLERGLDDIKKNILTTTSEPIDIFAEDPLRMLRAVRFECCKGFVMSDKIKDAISYCSRYLMKISTERINDEFSKIICSNFAAEGILFLCDTGLMNFIIPEVNALYGFNQYSKYHDADALFHTLRVVKKTKPILTHRLAALLHDIAKPLYHQDFYENGEIVKRQFIGHDVYSADLAKQILIKLKYSNDIINAVCFAIKNHMILKPHVDEQGNLKIKDSTCRKIYRTIFDYQDITLDLISADNMSHSPKYCLSRQVEQFIYQCKSIGLIEKIILPISGDDVMERFYLTPGPKVKLVLDFAWKLFDSHPDSDKEKLLTLIGKNIKQILK